MQESSVSTPGSENSISIPSVTPKPTPDSEKNDNDTSYDFSKKLVLNELVPNPIGEDTINEFIEIYNPENRSISLSGWTLDDSEKGSSPHRFLVTDTIASHQYLLIFRTVSGLALNNDKDAVRLIDPEGVIISQVAYTKTFEGLSFSRTEDDTYVWTTIGTPGKLNIIRVQSKPSPKVVNIKAPKVKGATTKKPVQAKQPRISSNATDSIIFASPSLLPWPEITLKTQRMSQGAPLSSPINSSKKAIFVFFGITMAFGQVYSGISNKEKIWHR